MVSLLSEGVYEDPETGELHQLRSRTMFQAAQLVGNAIRQVHRVNGVAMENAHVNFEVSFLLGGQIAGGPAAPVHDLCRRQFHRMHAGHALPADRQAQIRQAGARPRRRLRDGDRRRAEGVLISWIRPYADLGVGLPIDVVACPDKLQAEYRIEPGRPY